LLINACGESVSDKPAFRYAMRRPLPHSRRKRPYLRAPAGRGTSSSVPFLASREVQPSFPALAFANAVIAATRVRFVAARNSKNGARAAILGKRRVLG